MVKNIITLIASFFIILHYIFPENIYLDNFSTLYKIILFSLVIIILVTLPKISSSFHKPSLIKVKEIFEIYNNSKYYEVYKLINIIVAFAISIIGGDFVTSIALLFTTFGNMLILSFTIDRLKVLNNR